MTPGGNLLPARGDLRACIGYFVTLRGVTHYPLGDALFSLGQIYYLAGGNVRITPRINEPREAIECLQTPEEIIFAHADPFITPWEMISCPLGFISPLRGG